MSSRKLATRLGDYRRVLLEATAILVDPVALVTVTGPGWADLDPSPESIREWNRTAAHRWGRLDRAAKSRLRKQGLHVSPLFRIAQRQTRGVDHLHIGLDAPEGARSAIQTYVAILQELGPRYGFGWIDDPYHLRHPKGPDGKPDRSKPKRDMIFLTPEIAGRYLVRYLSESSQLGAMIEAGDHSFRAMWVAPRLTQASGVNCRRLRRVRHAWFVTTALAQGSRPSLPIWWRDLTERMAVTRLLRVSPSLANAP